MAIGQVPVPAAELWALCGRCLSFTLEMPFKDTIDVPDPAQVEAVAALARTLDGLCQLYQSCAMYSW